MEIQDETSDCINMQDPVEQNDEKILASDPGAGKPAPSTDDPRAAIKAALMDKLAEKVPHFYTARVGETLRVKINEQIVERPYLMEDAFDEAALELTLAYSPNLSRSFYDRAAKMLGVPSLWPKD